MGTQTAVRVIDEVCRQLARCLDRISANPTQAEMMKIGLVTFNNTARVHIPLSSLEDLRKTFGAIEPAGDTTSFRSWLELLERLIPHDMEEMKRNGWQGRRPLVILLTDGRAMDDPGLWLPVLDRLTDPANPLRPNIYPIGFGQANLDNLKLVARPTGSFRAALADRGMDPYFLATREVDILQQLDQVGDVAFASMVAAETAGQMDPNGEIVADGGGDQYPFHPVYFVVDDSLSMRALLP
ncbi:MAG: VWA domain-containing protein [Thermoleophilia bacterium]|nr:VWA domain-containing protein [Thermoleophilia bacterium]